MNKEKNFKRALYSVASIYQFGSVSVCMWRARERVCMLYNKKGNYFLLLHVCIKNHLKATLMPTL